MKLKVILVIFVIELYVFENNIYLCKIYVGKYFLFL